MKKLVILSLFIIGMFGCSKQNNMVNTIQSFNYSIDQKVSCFCPEVPFARIFVVADTIVNVISLSDSSPVPNQYWSYYRTIKGLFEFISLVDTSLFTIEVEYDMLHDYPSFVAKYPKPNNELRDVFMVFQTSNYIKY